MSVARPTFTPPAERRSVLDRAHVGDIEGALGTVASFDTAPRRSLRRRLATLLAIMGPGLVVMVADNDAGGLAIYAQAGQNYGASLLWVLLLLAPVLFINQEMVARLGAVTGAGHARLIVERFGRRWGAFAVGDLLVLNALTLVTEFIGVALALGYFGVSRYVAVPIAAALLIAVTAAAASAAGSARCTCSSRPASSSSRSRSSPTPAAGPGSAWRTAARGRGRRLVELVLLIIALAGTTVAPWQLFFQQSNVVDKRITPRWLAYERVDTLIGTILLVLGAVAVMLACAWAFAGTPLHGAFHDAGAVADGLSSNVSPLAGTLFAVALLDASLLGAAAVTLASSYAIGDYFGYKHSLHRGWRDATVFHGTYAAFIAVAAVVVLVPGAPLGLITTGVQALAGILLPSATVFLLLLCNDRHVLGPWVNPRWLNALAAVVVGVLVVLSTALTITTIFPHADLTTVASRSSSGSRWRWRPSRSRREPPARIRPTHRRRTARWTTPPLETRRPGAVADPPARARRPARPTPLAAALLLAKLIQLGVAA